MSHQRKKSLPQLLGGNKTLIMEFTGTSGSHETKKPTTALLFDGRSLRPMRFDSEAAALSWCGNNGANFYCMHAPSHGGN